MLKNIYILNRDRGIIDFDSVSAIIKGYDDDPINPGKRKCYVLVNGVSIYITETEYWEMLYCFRKYKQSKFTESYCGYLEQGTWDNVGKHIEKQDQEEKKKKEQEEKIEKENSNNKLVPPYLTKVNTNNLFEEIAGMYDLKKKIDVSVLSLIRKPEKAKSLGLKIPNGMLFYGPPGCGKTFFAERLAKTIGFNYEYVTCSTIATSFIHGGQSKIKEIFDKAISKAPTILFLDEIDSLVRSRDDENNSSMSGEVNEFLTQINNCSEKKLMVIGATNNPGLLDKAVLRTGRFDYKIYIGLPDFQRRIDLFKIMLKGRAHEYVIKYEILSGLTENFTASDIEFIISEAARKVMENDELINISQEILVDTIMNSKPSLSKDTIEYYNKLKKDFEK